MRKNLHWIIISTISVILFILIVKPIRTNSVMENIAKQMLTEEGPLQLFSENGEPIYEGIGGPKVTDRNEITEYTWYKVLEWGDTAKISAFVYKNFLNEFSGVFRKKNPPSVAADRKWYYVYIPNGISKFTDLLPNKHFVTPVDLNVFKLHSSQSNISDSISFIVSPNRLLFFLKKGYFEIVDKNDDYSIVDFYEHIAYNGPNIINENNSTISAKVVFNDSFEVIIMPYKVPIEIRNRK